MLSGLTFFLDLNPLSGVLLTRIFSINEHLLIQSTVHRSERYKLQIESINQYKRRTHELIVVLRSVSPHRGMKGIALVRKTHFFIFVSFAFMLNNDFVLQAVP